MPAMVVFTSEKLTDEEKDQMILDLNTMASQIVGVEEEHILIVINDGVAISYGRELHKKAVLMKLMGPIDREKEEKGSQLAANYFSKRGYEGKNIHITFEFQDGSHSGVGGKLVR